MIKFIQKQMNKDGFTLVELIIVIAVMAILAAIVVPRMSGITDTFKANADERSCATLARELEVRIQAGGISDAADIALTDVVDQIADCGTPSTGGDYQYSYVAATGTLTVTVTGGTPNVTDVVLTGVSEIE